MSNKTFPIGTFLAGLTIGAASVYFSDEKNRKKAKKALEEGLKTLDEVKENPQLLADMAKKKAEEAKQAADKAYQMAVKQAQKAKVETKKEVKRLTAKSKSASAKKTQTRKTTVAAAK